jgi:hypothetical protein
VTGALGDRIVISFDPNYRENDDGGGFVLRIRTAEPDDAPLVREFDKSAHQPLPQTADSGSAPIRE